MIYWTDDKGMVPNSTALDVQFYTDDMITVQTTGIGLDTEVYGGCMEHNTLYYI